MKLGFFVDLLRGDLIGLGGTTHPIPRARIGYWFGLYHRSYPPSFDLFVFRVVCVFGFGVGICGFLPTPRPFVPTTWKFSSSLTFGVCLGPERFLVGEPAKKPFGGEVGGEEIFLFFSQASSKLRVCLPLWFAARYVFRSGK